MKTLLQDLTDQALTLPPEARVDLAERLIESLTADESEEHRQLWVKEALRRRDEIDQSLVKMIPGEEVMAEARRIARIVSAARE